MSIAPRDMMSRMLSALMPAALLALAVAGCAHNPGQTASTGPASTATTSTSPNRQSARAGISWLDRAPANWNRKGSEPPAPASTANAAEAQTRCRDFVRAPQSPVEQALVRKGWILYGPAQFSERTEVILAMSGVDGMCRPLGYQAFVYREGRYAGTLSPVAMDSRTDGALASLRLSGPMRLSAEFLRYQESDPLCCPTRISQVTYDLSQNDMPLVVPVAINTRAAGTPGQGSDAKNVSSDANLLFGKKWRLTEVGGAAIRLTRPYIEFDREVKVFSGDAGCNRIAGSFEINGANLKFSTPVSMKRVCLSSEAQQIETSFLKGLELTTGFQIQGNILRLIAGDVPVLTFEAEPPAGAAR